MFLLFYTYNDFPVELTMQATILGAGTIAALGNNEGVVGVIPDANINGITLHIGKGLGDSGSSAGSSVLDAVANCIANGARIISMSLGSSGEGQTTREVYEDHYLNSNTLIIAAGMSFSLECFIL